MARGFIQFRKTAHIFGYGFKQFYWLEGVSLCNCYKNISSNYTMYFYCFLMFGNGGESFDDYEFMIDYSMF